MTAPDTQPQGETRTLAQQIRACADAVTTAALLDRRHVVAATLRDLADRAAETELRADRAKNARDQVGEMLHTAQEQRNQASARWHEERKHAAEAERERDLLRNALTVIRMIVEESATNDADLLRQAILEQLPPTVPAQHVQDATESHVAGRTAALAGTSAREGATGAQETAERCGKYSRPGLGGILGPCNKPPGHGDEWHFDPSGAAWDPASDPQPARPICPGCELPETNCACG